jgi:hypothetical protein
MKKKGAYRIKMNKENISLVVEVFYLCDFTRYASLFWRGQKRRLIF